MLAVPSLPGSFSDLPAMSSILAGVAGFPSPVPAVFAVVGEHRADPARLLLLGDDGRYYAYGEPDDAEDVVLVELTPDWVVDSAA